jgi:Leucine-rich repeat (LRR) protein
LSESGISTLPGQISSVPLEFIDISKNRLSILPKGIGNIKCLRYLCAQENILTILPGELSQCIELEHLDLSSNRLSSILISFSEFRKLRYLNLDENPLESFPDISRCIELSNVSFSNVNMWYRENDLGSRTIEVTCSFERKATSNSFVVTLFGPRQSDPLQEFFNLALCGTTHHPLVIGAISKYGGSCQTFNFFLTC